MSDNAQKYGQFCWNELMTPDAKKAEEFYSSLLDWETEHHSMGDTDYVMFKTGKDCKGVGGMMQIPKGQESQIPPHWMSYISVENLDDKVKKAQDLGATIKVPATLVGDFGRFAILVDPTGAHIALWQSLKTC